MSKNAISKIWCLFRILLSAALILAGLCLMGACLHIYHSGDHAFSREAVAAAFGPISVPVYLCLGMILFTFLGKWLLPTPEPRPVPARQTLLILTRLQEKTDLSRCPQALRESVLLQRRGRKIARVAEMVLLCVCCGVFLSYGMNPANFHQSQINASMIGAMAWFVPCFLIPFGFGIFCSYFTRSSMEQEIALLKTAPPESRITPVPPAPRRGLPWNLVRNGLLIIGIIILVYGFFAGGTADVLTKAVNICTECVGLG
ncbi:MAG: CD1871A family CXXC motif-containing protein [Faecousia sp.]